MSPRAYRHLRRRVSPALRMSLDVLWVTLARGSDWLGSAAAGRPPVMLSELRLLREDQFEVKYLRTKPDVEGVGRRVRSQLPHSSWRALRERKRVLPPSSPALPVSYSQLHAALRPYAIRAVRRGAVRAALMAGSSVRAVMAVTGHKAASTVLRYAGIIAPEDARRGLRVARAVLGPLRRRRR